MTTRRRKTTNSVSTGTLADLISIGHATAGDEMKQEAPSDREDVSQPVNNKTRKRTRAPLINPKATNVARG